MPCYKMDSDPEQFTKLLEQEGLSKDADTIEKMQLLWNLCTQAVTGLQATVSALEQGDESHTEEMTRMSQYIDHMRTLIIHQDTRIRELENAKQIQDKRLTRYSQHQEEVRQLLSEQDLSSEVVNATFAEQIAWLLFERSRLQGDLELAKGPSLPPQDDSDDEEQEEIPPKKLLEEEQKKTKKVTEEISALFEEELKNQRESSRQIKEDMAREMERLMNLVGEYEERTTALQRENHQVHSEFRSYMARMESTRSFDESPVHKDAGKEDKTRELELKCAASQCEKEQLEEDYESLQKEFEALQSLLESQKSEFEARMNEVNVLLITEKKERELLQVLNKDLNVKVDLMEDTVADEVIMNKNGDDPNMNTHSFESKNKHFDDKATQFICERRRSSTYQAPQLNNHTPTDVIARAYVSELETDVTSLRGEVARLQDRYSSKRERHKAKLVRARAYYRTEWTRLRSSLSNSQNELLLAKARALRAETALREVYIERTHQMESMADLESALSERTRQVSLLESRCAGLETQSLDLLSRLGHLGDERNQLAAQLRHLSLTSSMSPSGILVSQMSPC